MKDNKRTELQSRLRHYWVLGIDLLITLALAEPRLLLVSSHSLSIDGSRIGYSRGGILNGNRLFSRRPERIESLTSTQILSLNVRFEKLIEPVW